MSLIEMIDKHAKLNRAKAVTIDYQRKEYTMALGPKGTMQVVYQFDEITHYLSAAMVRVAALENSMRGVS